MNVYKDLSPEKIAFDKRQMRLVFVAFAILIIVFASLILVLLSN